MDLENTVLSEISQSWWQMAYDPAYTRQIRIGKFIETESRLEVIRE